ncbi:STAS domain-containing protein [Actinacidiphila rubida]|nr:STAS domain-containing protein [Actinacidiphila rubida]
MTDAENGGQPVRLTVATSTTEGIRVLTLAGEIDHHTGDTLRGALDTSGTPHPRIVVDLRQVTFMDSSGINILIAAHHALHEAGGWLRLAAPTGAPLRTITILGVDAVIDCRATLHQALTD